ncbi:hypothetical protein PSCLAVI8L_100181 [Pseudoclavibacter sp. 8L]|nr:hypothetical protein PSCLAVI8L_100181 [Pseudoclavibacter sp. 8L]
MEWNYAASLAAAQVAKSPSRPHHRHPL